ncbi:DUF4190 domain-containing protein [uncultured Rothia sp.]|uniref:DUF4190 domain-containing protein n=1 Tax=uncultured Rothia sp. TaxID=316088 RepID=UPI0028D0A084|nr:DUF4190 domain-containing protein [uncultured Rothia sp.]
MSQNPQGSSPEDSDPEYNQLNEQLAELSAQDSQDTSGQPAMLPADTVQKIIERTEGERAAQTSLVLGLVSLVCLGSLAGVPSFIMGYIGMSRAKEAERLGVSAVAGRRMSQIGVYLSLLIFICTCVFTLMGIIGSQQLAS